MSSSHDGGCHAVERHACACSSGTPAAALACSTSARPQMPCLARARLPANCSCTRARSIVHPALWPCLPRPAPRMWAKRRKEIAAIEAAWKAGKDVVSLSKNLDKEETEGGDEDEEDEEEAPRKTKQQQQQPDGDYAEDGGGDDGDSEESEEAQQQQGNSGGKPKAQGGEVEKRRSLRERGAAGSKPTGEGSRRRGHRTRGSRALLQAAGDAATGHAASAAAAAASSGSESEELILDEAAEVARQATEHEEQLKAMPTILQRVRRTAGPAGSRERGFGVQRQLLLWRRRAAGRGVVEQVQRPAMCSLQDLCSVLQLCSRHTAS